VPAVILFAVCGAVVHSRRGHCASAESNAGSYQPSAVYVQPEHSAVASAKYAGRKSPRP